MNKIKIIIEHHYTKRDMYGNVYHVAILINPKNSKRFSTSTPSTGNVYHIISDAFGGHVHTHETETCTDSARLSSLPESMNLACCRYNKEWKKALNGIGYRNLKAVASC